jgi:hypothetical protein
MHEKRNFILILVVAASAVWAILSWFRFGEETTLFWPQRIGSLGLLCLSIVWLAYGMWLQDKLPDHMRETIGPVYYEADGVSFLPLLRSNRGQAELSVYYQNRFENPAQVIIHLRPPADGFIIKSGMRDVHFAFKADGGDFGVIHQPIAVPPHLQGEVLEVQLAAASYFPRSHGACWRRKSGLPCGTLPVDWGGAAFRIGVHEVSGEIELNNPITLHMSMPARVASEVAGNGGGTWRQELIAGGEKER